MAIPIVSSCMILFGAQENEVKGNTNDDENSSMNCVGDGPRLARAALGKPSQRFFRFHAFESLTLAIRSKV
ncbi:hypothetical protein LshimejAT787_1401900 [Lyophyllum shimeji]|uniref:Uncharacterized protein n=1 Tax=Lyophyllum shimeji TaxID=47721 RepID=A0A9P3PXA6_LYOSH|nr:hypothetical protein LshimejAT787_1401900 [Lyophyllum shimeji]